MIKFKSLNLALVLGAVTIVALSFGSYVHAQTLQDVLNAVRSERNQVSKVNKQRETRFVADRNSQRSKLAVVRSQVLAAKNAYIRFENVKDANDIKIEKLQAELTDKQGAFGELFGAARSAADDLAQQLDNSIISAQLPGRSEALYAMAQSEVLPTLEQFETLWIAMIEETTRQSEVASFSAEIVGTDNTKSTAQVTRVGPFVAFSGNKYLLYKGAKNGDKYLTLLPRQPNAAKRDAAKTVVNASADGKYVRGVIDPSLGSLLGLEVEKPTLSETIAQGKFVGQIIIWIAIIAGIIGLVKIVLLAMTSMSVSAQARKKTGTSVNPLGRIFLAYESNKSSDVETLSLKLDDAILRELPKLNSFVDIIKVVAAVAPLLGLLGTVIGMINTFQAITLFGTGDPQIMAGGISEALVTTVLGLVAAIPLLIIHAFASGLSKSVSEVLESQAAGMIAEHAEKSN